MNNAFRRTVSQCGIREFDGRQRVVIENVAPELDGGKYRAKAVEGGMVTVEADIFVDGADTLCAEICFRPGAGDAWQRTPMAPIGNDRWRGSFKVGLPGTFFYTIEAWPDHFLTWRKGLAKKVDAGMDVSLDLQIGAQFVDSAAARASKTDAAKLKKFSEVLRSGKGNKPVSAGLGDDLGRLMELYPDKSLAAVYEKELGVTVEQKKAGFGAWYELFPRSWSEVPGKHGTFNDCLRLLPMIAGMGFDIIYLPPIHPIGYTKRKGKNNALSAASGDPGSCWAIGNKDGGHKAVHPELGTIDEFAAFVEEAEILGISVALDIAFQCSPERTDGQG
ncbi:MAG: DUF3416 domain-containing protein, partial [Chlorobiaceae bacterium]|nr:DUF3416 domain-containing protein [Chlorobiaceae bacterium]